MSRPESQKKVRDQAVAWDPISQKMMNNTELYVRYREMSEKLKMEETAPVQQIQDQKEPNVMFTAIIIRLKPFSC